MKLNLVMPMGGGGTRFGNQGYEMPKPLIEIYGHPFFYWAARSVTKMIPVQSVTFVVLQEHMERFQIDRKIRAYYPEAHIEVLPEVLPGAVLTCLRGTKEIPEKTPILFNDCDHLFLCETFCEFCRQERFDTLDGGLLTFRSADSRFSYAECDADGYVVRTVEKEPVSDNAICGAYYFRNRSIFENAAGIYLKQCAYSEFFVSGIYNVLAERGGKIKCFQTDQHISFGTPEEYETVQNDSAYLQLK